MGMPSLVLGSIELMDWSGSIYGASVIAEGTSVGAPVPIEVAVKSWLQDGAVVVTQGYDNRTVALRVRLRGPDLVAVAEAEAALFAELGKPNTLTWTPGDGLSPASVFVVVTSSMEHAPSASEDIAEGTAYPWHTFNLRLLCEAFVRSETETVTAALPASGTTTTLVNNGSATTNWTGAVNGVATTPSVVSGAVKVASSPATGSVKCALTLTTAIDTSSTKYLAVDWKPESSTGNPNIRAYGDGTELTLANSVGLPSGFTRTWFGPVSASAIAALKLESTSVTVPTFLGFNPSSVRSLSVDNIDRTDAKPAIGTNRQLQRQIAVGGSARAPGSLIVQHETSALGDVMAYVWGSGTSEDQYSPPMRQYRTSGGSVTTDAAMVSGARETLSGDTVFTIPNNALPPGLYLVDGRLKFSPTLGTCTLTPSAKLTVGGTQVGPTLTGAPRVFSGSVMDWTNVPLCRFNLPAAGVQAASSSNTVITLSCVQSFTSTLELDELWLFNSTIGALIKVSCGTSAPAAGGASNRLFIDQPTIERPRPVVMVGYAADGSDAHYPDGEFNAWQLPQFTPPAVNVLTVCSNALDAAVSFRAFAHWHSHAAS